MLAETRDRVELMLDSSAEAVEAAIVAIHQRATQEARLPKTSPHVTGIAFDPTDAIFMSVLAAQLNRGKKLLPDQLQIARRKLKRQWRLLWQLQGVEPIPATVLAAANDVTLSPAVIAAQPDFGTW